VKILKPEVFQGSLKRKNYFEGWYFKNVSFHQDEVYAFIPGISLSKNDSHAFIQIINGITGDTSYITYPAESFQWKKDRLHVKIGNSVFSENFIHLNIDEPNIKIKGQLTYSDLSKFPSSLFSPGIMSWYSFIPFMECYHGIVSANHSIEGKLEVNSKQVNFDDGKGYLEKDWGTSFPECWIWLQSNSFTKKDSSLFVSIAKIPWIGKFFIGFIAFIYLDGQFITFASYNHSALKKVKPEGNQLHIILENRLYTLKIWANTKNSGELIAPHNGTMTRRIKESIDSEVHYELINKKTKEVVKDASSRAGLEIIEEIFNYLSKN